MDVLLVLFIVFIIFILWVCIKNSSNISRAEENMIKDNPVKTSLEKKARVIQTYFFNDDKSFSFEKFCDYVLCIRKDEPKNTYLEYLAEFELLLAYCDQLGPILLNILMEEKSIIAIAGTEPEFEALKGYIREGKFKGTYGDLCYILFATVFYLKYKIRTNEQS